MKKRFAACFLALILCLGLAVPSLAAEGEEASIFPAAPENSGVILEGESIDLKLVGFSRSGSGNSHITYGTYEPVDGYEEYAGWDNMYTPFVPKGIDLVVAGVSSAEEVYLQAFATVEMKEGPWKMPGGTYNFYRLFTWETGKEAALAPLDANDPMKFEYDDPQDGKLHVAGRITAADAGFRTDEDGNVVIDSQRLYGLLGEGGLVRVEAGGYWWLFRLSGEPTLISDAFGDVDVGKWFTDPIAWAWQNDIAAGKSENAFGPQDTCTQAQILTFLYRAEREEQAAASAKDMEMAVTWAREKGMIDDSFDGSEPCTRAAAVSFIWQAKGKPDAAASGFTDMEGYEQYAKAVDWANAEKITTGVGGGKFNPGGICNRAEIATFLYKAYN